MRDVTKLTPQENTRLDRAIERLENARRAWEEARRERHQAILHARRVGLTFREIADALGTSSGNVHKVYRRRKPRSKESA